MGDHVHEWLQCRDGNPPRCACGADQGVIQAAERAVIEAAKKDAGKWVNRLDLVKTIEGVSFSREHCALIRAVAALQEAEGGQ